MVKNIDEKNREINELKEKIKELELYQNKLERNFDEIKNKYDDLLNNSKSAEKINYYINKVSQLNEEKGVILSTNAESIKDLTNQIYQLNFQLNEYKNKELNIKPKYENKSNKKEKEKYCEVNQIKPLNQNEEIPKCFITENSEKQVKNVSLNQNNQGFLTRFLAPIFLTENERNKLNE